MFGTQVQKSTVEFPSLHNSHGCVTSLVGRSNEDRYVIAKLNGVIMMYAVFDGHGGHATSDYLKRFLPYYIAESLLGVDMGSLQNVSNILTNLFLHIDRQMFNQWREVGSTASIALRWFNKVYLINLGDSRTVIFNDSHVIFTTKDHKPGDQEETERINKTGGFVSNFLTPRVDGYLAISRAFGDTKYKYHEYGPVWNVPDITVHSWQPGIHILIGSDGLFDVLSSEEAAKDVLRFGCEATAHKARKGTTDDITVMFIK